jgi:hypothetical protein
MVKILVTGDVLGKLDSLYNRIRKLQAKGQSFSELYCVGSFFPTDGSECPEWDDYKTGEKRIPISTYILGPSNVAESKFYAGLDNGGELCANIMCLGMSWPKTLGPLKYSAKNPQDL